MAVTDDLTADFVWQEGGSYTDLLYAQHALFRFRATFGGADAGIFFETGGYGYGTVCYMHNGVLYAQGGDGAATEIETKQIEVSAPIPDGAASRLVEVYLSAEDGEGALWLDGELVDRVSKPSWVDIAGNNEGSYGSTAGGAVAVNRAGFTAPYSVVPGTLETDLFIYEDKPSTYDLEPHTYAEAVKTTGALHYWPLQGDTTEAVQGIDGTVQGSVTPSSNGPPVDGSTSHDFTGGHITFGAQDVGWDTFSVELWMQSDATGSNMVLFWGDDGGDGLIYLSQYSTSEFAGGFTDPDFAEVLGGTSDGSWQHVVYVSDGSAIRLYVDGVEVGSVTATVSTFQTLTGILGQHPDGSQTFDGRLAHVATYDRPLTLAEIEEHRTFTVPVPPPPPPTDYQNAVLALSPWAFWGFEGSFADSTANGNALTAGGSPTYGNALVTEEGSSLSSGYGTRDPYYRQGNWTVTAWINVNNTVDQQVVVDMADRNNGLMIIVDDNLVYFGAKADLGGGNRVTGFTSAPINVGKTYMVTGVHDGTDLRLYINGVEVDSHAFGHQATTQNAGIVAWGVGASGAEIFDEDGTPVFSTAGEYPVLGRIDEVAVFDKTLTAAQIADLYSIGGTPVATFEQTISSFEGDVSAYVVPTVTFDQSLSAYRGEVVAWIPPVASFNQTLASFEGDVTTYVVPQATMELGMEPFEMEAFGLNQTGKDKAYIRSLTTGGAIAYRKGSLSGREQLQACDTFRFSINLKPDEISPLEVGEPIRISADEREENVILGGYITRMTEENLSSYPSGAPEGVRTITYEGQCYTALAQKRLVAGVWEDTPAGEIVEALVTQSVATEGVVTTDGDTSTVSAGPTLSRVTLKYQRLSDAMNKLAERAGFSWYIDAYKRLRFFERTEHQAPFDITPTSRPYRSLTKKAAKEDYRNRQYVKGGKELTPIRTEEFTGDGHQRNFTLRFPVGEKPSVRVNGVPQEIGIGELESGADWYWNKGRNQISQDDSAPQLENDDVLSVLYRGIVPVMVEHTDAEAAAERRAVEGGTGLHERIEMDTSIERRSEASEQALSLLRRYAQIKEQITFSTYQPGLEKGQLMSITLPEVHLDGDYLIDSVQWQADSRDKVMTTATVVSGESLGGWQGFFRNLLQQASETTIGEEEQVLLVRTIRDRLIMRHQSDMAEVTTETSSPTASLTMSWSFSMTSTPTSMRIGDPLGEKPLG